MGKFFVKIKRWWLFTIGNPTVRSGEAGGYKWRFRRFWLEISTISGNFKVRFTAAEHPYGYLSSGDDSQTHGFAERMYLIGMLLTTDQKFVSDIDSALKNYESRAEGTADDTDNEQAAIAEVRNIQEYADASQKERRKMERDSNGRFKKVMKDVQKGTDGAL